MKNHLNRFLVISIAICAVASSSSAASEATGSSYFVTTLAGSGLSGVRDGDAKSAQFIKPVGIAVDDRGNVYVADAGAQRIREISPGGDVSTIGGSGTPIFNSMWVFGGYKDGQALDAQFNRPSGVAVGPDGTIYVADTLNHCIRIIKDGFVSTYAGSPNDTSGDDGPIAKASFQRPRALAFDAMGDLFVADYSIGIRKISSRNVTTLPLLPEVKEKRFLSIAFSGPSNSETMYVGTATELVAFDRDLKVVSRQTVSGGETLYGMRGALNVSTVDQSQETGPAFGIAPYGDGRIIFADARSHALRAMNNIAQPLAQTVPRLIPDAADLGGGYRDGPIGDAQFDAPMGLAVLPDGSVAVADMGNRRIRKLTLVSTGAGKSGTTARVPDLTSVDSSIGGEIVAGEDPFSGIPANYYRIAYLGNSYAFFDTRWADSIPGLVEAQLRSNWQALGFPRPPKLVCISPIQGLSGFRDYIDNILSLGVVDAVILQLNAVNIAESFPPPHSATYDFNVYAKKWTTPTIQFIVDMNKQLEQAGIPLVIVVTPTAAHLSPLEVAVTNEVTGFQDWMFLQYGPPSGDTFDADMRRVTARSGVRSINLFPEFLAAERGANRVPLFGTTDSHYSRNGRILAAKVIVNSLIQMHFWLNN